jgi:16S rRNA processing protein RimM
VADVASGRPDPDHLVVGHVSKPHGTKGEVFVWPLTDRPEEVFAAGQTVVLGDDRGSITQPVDALEVERLRPFKRGQLVKFTGRDDREAVEDLAGRYLLVPATDLRELEEGEVFYHQLLGAEVVTSDGEVVGRVREVFETEPAHLLEVKTDEGKVHLVPFSKRIVREVDAEAGRILIVPPPGLLEL